VSYGRNVIRQRVIVSGTVQGVFFRDTCRRVASELGLAGWVRNRGYDSVEAVFEGPPDLVRQAVDWARRGPSRAVVETVQVFDEQPQGERGFEIRIDTRG
jgi:acylphosphatase